MIDPIVQIYQLLTLALIMFASFKDNLLNSSLSCIIIKVIDTIPVTVADLEGVQGVCSNPPLEPNYFVFMGNLKKF